jgi:hypothetical protein
MISWLRTNQVEDWKKMNSCFKKKYSGAGGMVYVIEPSRQWVMSSNPSIKSGGGREERRKEGRRKEGRKEKTYSHSSNIDCYGKTC